VIAGYPAVRAGFSALLAQQSDFVLLNPLPSPGEDDSAPDVILIDAGSTSEESIEDLGENYPRAALLLVGADPAVDGPGLVEGAIGYLSANSDAAALAIAVRAVSQGLTVVDPALIAASGLHSHAREITTVAPAAGDLLSAREREVLNLVAAGYPNKAIAHELGISEHTAKFHVGSLLAKLGAGSRTEAVTLATRRGILSV
jgi:DNA-binding NarL/FixJ family response regulator